MIGRARGRCLFLALPSVLVLTWLGCAPAQPRGETLVVISPHREEIRDEVEWGFAAWLAAQPGWENRPATIEWRDIGQGTTGIIRYLQDQYRVTPDSVGIDLLYGGGTDIYLDFKDKKLLEKFELPPALAAKIPQNVSGVDFRDQDGYWHGVMLSSLGILYNEEVLELQHLTSWAPPKQWQDLGNPELVGRVSAADPRMSGSVRMLYELILQTYGWDEGFRQLMRMGANTRGFARFSDGVTKDVVFGRAVAGGTLDSYGYSAVTRDRQKANPALGERTSLRFVFPKNETLLSPDSIGILKGAPHKELAAKFVEYNLSEEGGQRLWMLQPQTLPFSPRRYAICRLSVMPRMYDEQLYPMSIRSVPINPFDEQQIGKLIQFNNKKADRRRNVMSDLFGVWIVDTHQELSAAWRAVLAAQSRADLEKRLFQAPCSEQELDAFNNALRQGPRPRADLLKQWLDDARARYAAIEREAATK